MSRFFIPLNVFDARTEYVRRNIYVTLLIARIASVDNLMPIPFLSNPFSYGVEYIRPTVCFIALFAHIISEDAVISIHHSAKWNQWSELIGVPLYRICKLCQSGQYMHGGHLSFPL
jgi:hypothetical protein